MASHSLRTKPVRAGLYWLAHMFSLVSAYLVRSASRDYDAPAYDPQWQAAIRRMAERREAGRPMHYHRRAAA